MSHNNTVLSQFLKLVCRHEFESLSKQHHQGQKLRKMSRWAQFTSLMLAQLTGRTSLRDIESNMAAQQSKLYHLGVQKVSRSTLARVNENQPSSLYEALFNRLLHRCQSRAPRHGFRFKNRLLSMDASTIKGVGFIFGNKRCRINFLVSSNKSDTFSLNTCSA